MAYTCFACEDDRAAVVQIFTSLENGHTVAACEDCLPIAFIGGLSTVLGVDANKLFDVIKRFADKQARDAARLPEGGQVPIEQFLAGSTDPDAQQDAEVTG